MSDEQEKTEPTQEELEAKELAKASDASPAIHEQGVTAADKLQDGAVDESEEEDHLAD